MKEGALRGAFGGRRGEASPGVRGRERGPDPFAGAAQAGVGPRPSAALLPTPGARPWGGADSPAVGSSSKSSSPLIFRDRGAARPKLSRETGREGHVRRPWESGGAVRSWGPSRRGDAPLPGALSPGRRWVCTASTSTGHCPRGRRQHTARPLVYVVPVLPGQTHQHSDQQSAEHGERPRRVGRISRGEEANVHTNAYVSAPHDPPAANSPEVP